MGTLSHLLDEVDKLPARGFVGGVDVSHREQEFQLLDQYLGVSTPGVIKRGCRNHAGQREIQIRVFNGKVQEIFIRRTNSAVVVIHNGAQVHISTISELIKYIAALHP